LDRGEPHFAGRGGEAFFEDDVAPLDASLRRVLEVQLHGRLRRLGRDLVGAGDARLALAVDRSVERVFRFCGGARDGGGDGLALGVRPHDAHEAAVTRVRHADGPARGAELHEVAALHGEGLLIPSVEAFAGVLGDDEPVAVA